MLIRAAIFVLLISSCGRQSFEHAGAKREYLIHVPDHDSEEKLPVLFVLHGNPSNGWQMQTWTGMNETADKHSFIVVYPYALEKRWPVDPARNIDEINYFEKLISHLKRNYSVDTSRFYLSGISGGGIFSFQLIRSLPDTFAAFAVVSGNLPRSSGVLPATPFMYVHGTDDFLYPGREDLLSADETLEMVMEFNSCEGNGHEVSLPDKNEKDESTVTRLEFDCGSPVLYYRVNGGGHHWPGATFDANLFYSKPLGSFNKDLDTNQAIWEFCSAFRRD